MHLGNRRLGGDSKRVQQRRTDPLLGGGSIPQTTVTKSTKMGKCCTPESPVLFFLGCEELRGQSQEPFPLPSPFPIQRIIPQTMNQYKSFLPYVIPSQILGHSDEKSNNISVDKMIWFQHCQLGCSQVVGQGALPTLTYLLETLALIELWRGKKIAVSIPLFQKIRKPCKDHPLNEMQDEQRQKWYIKRGCSEETLSYYHQTSSPVPKCHPPQLACLSS